MYIDNNGFLSLPSDISNPKLYIHTLGSQHIASEDHLVLVWHKEQLKIINWKDLGKTMQLIKAEFLTELQMTFNYNMLTLFSGFDEQSGKSYYFFPKAQKEKLESIESSLGIISLIDREKGWFELKNKDEAKDSDNLYQLFVLYCITGKALTKGDSLLSIKIQITIPAPFFSRKEIIDGLLKELQLFGYNIAGYYVQQNNGGIYEIATSDYDILSYIQKHDKGLASVKKITTKELADQVRVLLMDQYPESKELMSSASKIKLFEVK